MFLVSSYSTYIFTYSKPPSRINQAGDLMGEKKNTPVSFRIISMK